MTWFGLHKYFARRDRHVKTEQRPCPFFEVLEDRRLPSMMMPSPMMPPPTVSVGGNAAFFTDSMGMLMVFQNGQVMNTGQTVKTFSAGVDMQGNPEAFFITMNSNQLGRWDNGMVMMFDAFGTTVASANGVAHFTDGSNRLYIYLDSNGSFTSTMAFATRIAAGVNSMGMPQVAITDGMNQLWAMMNGQFMNTGAFATRLTEGLDSMGNSEVWFTDANNRIWRWDQGMSQMTGGFALQISGSKGQVFFLDGNNELMVMTDGMMTTNTGAFAMQISVSPSTGALLDGNNELWMRQGGMFMMTGAFA
jgi:10-bladed beta propeller domain-containing protein